MPHGATSQSLCHTREPHLPALRATAPARGRAGEAKKTGVKMEREKTKKKEKAQVTDNENEKILGKFQASGF